MINLQAQKRDKIGRKISRERANGLIPAVVYGNKIEPRSLWVNYLDFQKIYKQAGKSIIIELNINEDSKNNVLIHDVQMDPVSGKFSHVDFFQVKMDQKLEANVPLEFVGESEAVKTLGGVLVKILDNISVSCLPGDLPAKIEVDISSLKTFDDVIKISDLKISDKIKIQAETNTVIANVSAPRSEEELASLEGKVEEDVTKVEGVVKATAEPEKSQEKE